MRRMFALSLFALSAYLVPVASSSSPSSSYLMYVWHRSFEQKTASPECGVAQFDKDDYPQCRAPYFETTDKIDDLIASARVPGREIGRLLTSSLPITDGTCDSRVVYLLREAHKYGIEVYMLYAASDAAFSEVELIPRVNDWNTLCGSTDADLRFDGVSVNNEAFHACSSSDPAGGDPDDAPTQLAWIGRLAEASAVAHSFGLRFHFSTSWRWGYCSTSSDIPLMLTFNGTTKPAHYHMLDQLDSVDVQVAWTSASTMLSRSHYGGLDYAESIGVEFFTLAYLNENSDCRLSFFPFETSCSVGIHTEQGMFDAFDELALSTNGVARGGLHYYKGVFASGLPGWPRHDFRSNIFSTAEPAPAADVVADTHINPERGLMRFTSVHASELLSAAVVPSPSYPFIDTAAVREYRQSSGSSLLFRLYVLDSFAETNSSVTPPPISPEFLTQLQFELNAVRAGSMKLVLRFCYSDSLPDSLEAVFGEPPLATMLSHIAAIAQVLRVNSDVVAAFQAGFIGTWGEWYYTTHFGGQTGLTAQNWADRAMVHQELLSLLPDLTIQLRSPEYKAGLLASPPGSHTAIVDASSALTAGEAHTDSDDARTGHHNDCFLASSTDSGTYPDDSQSQYAYLSQETLYTVMGGETCAVSDRSVCSVALEEMELFHYTYLNADYHPDVLDSWRGDCFTEISNRLGYRLGLTSLAFPRRSYMPGDAVRVMLAVENSGFAAPISNRTVQIVLRHAASGQTCFAAVPETDTRTWIPGTDTHSVDVSLHLPSSFASGSWQLLLALSDPNPSLALSPAHRILLVNGGVGEPSTGFNNLHASLHVVDGSVTEDPSTDALTVTCGDLVESAPVAAANPAECAMGWWYYDVSSECVRCSAGYYCPAGSTFATSCMEGTFSVGGQASCTTCPDCGAHGSCSPLTGGCVCQAGYSGAACQTVTLEECPSFLSRLLAHDGAVFSPDCEESRGHVCDDSVGDWSYEGVPYWPLGSPASLNMRVADEECPSV